MYSVFVKSVIDIICETMEFPDGKLAYFSEVVREKKFATVQEYAVLFGEYADYYTKVIHENKDVFEIDEADYQCGFSRSKGRKYEHSCYQKNIRRWIKGTVSRKKKCRVEFVALAVCWATGWGNSSDKSELCQKKLLDFCADILGECEENVSTQSLVDNMWKACNKCYMNKS